MKCSIKDRFICYSRVAKNSQKKLKMATNHSTSKALIWSWTERNRGLCIRRPQSSWDCPLSGGILALFVVKSILSPWHQWNKSMGRRSISNTIMNWNMNEWLRRLRRTTSNLLENYSLLFCFQSIVWCGCYPSYNGSQLLSEAGTSFRWLSDRANRNYERESKGT